MSQQKRFNPIQTARTVENLYREYIATTIHFDDKGLQSQLEAILRKRRFLAKGPFLEAAPPYKPASSVRALVDEGVLCKGMLELGGFDVDRPLYEHQERAVRKAAKKENYVVVTGTGSGKTESFLLPIVNDILSEFENEGQSSGIRAMILYPMNALANDQLKRLRVLLEGTDITFGRYTGDTETKRGKALRKWQAENPGQNKLPNEIISREEIRENPPNILLTNYSMLEYLLLRPEDASLFGSAFGSKWRHIAIDEAHVYTGALGTEIAYLIRRLKGRIASEVGAPPALQCYATSATIGSDKDMPEVANFAQGLFGEPFASDSDDPGVITSETDSPVDALAKTSWGALPLDTWKKLREFVGTDPKESKASIAELLAPNIPNGLALAFVEGRDTLLALGRILLGEESTIALVKKMSEGLLDLTNIDKMDEIGIRGLRGSDDGIEVLTAMVEVLSWAQRAEDVPILTSRYHSFLRAPEGIFINLRDMRLIEHKSTLEISQEGYKIPVYETSVCRHCGQAYILGKEQSISDSNPHSWLNPKHSGTNADDEFIPRVYYRLIPEGEEPDPSETVQWLCPTCGSLASSEDEHIHCFEHDKIKRIAVAWNQSTESDARCNHCGYRSQIAIHPMRISPESAGTVVCYDLVRDIPAFKTTDDDAPKSRFSKSKTEKKRGGNVICFSDRRQDAAFFAPVMKRSYGKITVRQLIREAVEAKSVDGEGCTPSQVIRWIANTGFKRYSGFMEPGEKEEQAEAWIVDELTAEDSRNSLEGLGIVRIEPTDFINGLKEEGVSSAIEKEVDDLKGALPWLSASDYVLFLRICLETLRERGAIEISVGVEDWRTNHSTEPGEVVLGESDSEKSDVNFVGNPNSTVDNKRAAFIRKYARKVYGEEIARNHVRDLLKSLYGFLVEYLRDYFVDYGYLKGNSDRFRLNKDIWKMYPHSDDDTVYRCDSCGCESHIDTNGVCTTNKCEGTLKELTFDTAKTKDRYYKDLYCQEALPIEVEEHTAQLSSERARLIQSRFIKGDVNVLSCTTTFELGVDVGDLRAIFMRNVPPSTANYTQRAGRVGRRAGMPGYALTFCRLRPHDIAHFEDPRRIIAGETKVPFCYMENSVIAIRHVFAVALSEFFRHESEHSHQDYSHTYNDFMSLREKNPEGLERLAGFLRSRPDAVSQQLEVVFSPDSEIRTELGIDDWSWVDKLVSPEEGRLTAAHGIKKSDYDRINEALSCSQNSNERSKLEKSKGALEAEQTISVLAENGILPKYGFPTDLVELHLRELDHRKKEERLQLQRGLRQAITEYAPGSEIVAGGELWRSTGIRKQKGHELIKRNFGKCQCGAFVWPIDDLSDKGECPVCHSSIELKKIMLIPSLGFEGVKVKKGIGVRKPRATGHSKIYFVQHSLNEVVPSSFAFPGGSVEAKFSGNGQLCVANTNGTAGFSICNYCGAAAGFKNDVAHEAYCRKNNPAPTFTRIDALGTSFTSDVLELVLSLDGHPMTNESQWESVMWAIFTAAARILDIPQTELGGTLYGNDHGGMSLLIYDDVPGGAGHAQQLSGMVEELIKAAYETVDGHCGCGPETCCYGCIANYYNQPKQAELSRGAAKGIFEKLLGVSEGENIGIPSPDNRFERQAETASDLKASVPVYPEFTHVDYSSSGLKRIGEDARADTESGTRIIEQLKELDEERLPSFPEPNVVFGVADDEFVALLAWEEPHVAVIERGEYEHLSSVLHVDAPLLSGWSLLVADEVTLEEVLGVLEGERK